MLFRPPDYNSTAARTSPLLALNPLQPFKDFTVAPFTAVSPLSFLLMLVIGGEDNTECGTHLQRHIVPKREARVRQRKGLQGVTVKVREQLLIYTKKATIVNARQKASNETKALSWFLFFFSLHHILF